jgi:hypothetical protein
VSSYIGSSGLVRASGRGHNSFRIPDLLWETEVTGIDRLGYPLPAGEEGVPCGIVVCDEYHLWKLIRNRLSDRLSHPVVTLCLFLLEDEGIVHLHSLVVEWGLPQWLFDESRIMDDRPPILISEYGACHRACEA